MSLPSLEKIRRAPSRLITQLFLRYATPLAGLRRVHLLGSLLARLGGKLVPLDTLHWIQIEKGPAAGTWLHLNSRFDVDYARENYESVVRRAPLSHARPGSVFYDVGAHLGIFSLIVARLVGPQGRILAFEPDPTNIQRIREYIERNHLPVIESIPKAVWSSVGTLQFERANPRSSLNRGSLAPVAPLESGVTIEVDTITLDEFARRNPRADLIKLDVEGAEADVLVGAEIIFRTCKPVIVRDIHRQKAALEVVAWLGERGYECTWLEDSTEFPRHLLAKWRN